MKQHKEGSAMIVVVCFMMIAVMASLALWSMTMTFSRQAKKTRDKAQAGILARSVATLVEKELRQGRIVSKTGAETILYEVELPKELDAWAVVMIVWKDAGACATTSDADARKAMTTQTERKEVMTVNAKMVQTQATPSDCLEEEMEYVTAPVSEWELRVSCTIRNATTTVVRTSDHVMGEEREDEIVLEDDIHAMQKN